MYTPEYKAALMKTLNQRGEPRTFHGFHEGDLVQMELISIEIGRRAMSSAGYAEGYVTDPHKSYFVAEQLPGDLKDMEGYELGLGADTMLRPPRGPRMAATLHRAMVAGREALFYKTADIPFHSRFGDPLPEHDRRPMARYGRVMVAGTVLFDVRPDSTLQ